MSSELPYALQTCFILPMNASVDSNNVVFSIADILHMLNQGLLKVFINLFYLEEWIYLAYQ